MSTQKNQQERVPMTLTKTPNQIETTTATTSIVEIHKKSERANWSNRIVYLLSIIGFVVDLGKIFLYKIQLKTLFFFIRQCLAFSNNMLSKWWWCLSYSLFHFLIPRRSSL
jgi:hypothetical protein